MKTKSIVNDIIGEFNGMVSTVEWMYEAIVVEPKEVSFTNLSNIKEACDFVSACGPYLFITVNVGAETYRNNIFQHLDVLKVRISRFQVDKTGTVIPGGAHDAADYNATVINPPDMSRATNSVENDTPAATEMASTITLTLQLLDAKLNEMLLTDVAGVYEDVTVDELIDFHMSHGLEDLTSTSHLNTHEYKEVRGVETVGADNTKRYRVITVKDPCRLPGLVKMLQNKLGVFKTGAGSFFMNGWWYSYPLYNYERYASAEKKLTVIIARPDQLSSMERTYKIESQEVTLVATGKVASTDKRTSDFYNAGNGVAWVNSSDAIDGLVKKSGNKATINKGANVNKAVINQRENGLNNVKWSGEFTDNPYVMLSTQALQLGTQIVVTWTNSDSRLLIPGMPIKVIYEFGGEFLEFTGTLLAFDTNTNKQSGTVFSRRFFQTTRMLIHAKRTV